LYYININITVIQQNGDDVLVSNMRGINPITYRPSRLYALGRTWR